MNVNNNKLLRTHVVWLFLLAVLGLAHFPAYAQTPDPGVPTAQTTDPNATSAQQSGSNPVTEIVSLLQKNDQALNQKDLDALMSLYATGETTVLVGAGPGEKWVGKAEIGEAYKHFFQDTDKGSLMRDCFWKTGASNGDVAWLSAICKMGDSLKGRKREYELNISAVFERQGGL